jgi:geranylgeranyl pyrophosphate synthase/uncharacterized protein with NAD-binding domain and iron-sulfur cluster
MTRVVVLGGGVAGMSAAQELGERGFEVVVLERRASAGGKARSLEVTRDQLGAFPAPPQVRKGEPPWVPGEHGFRFFPGFYKHVVDSMGRIPAGPGRTVADNLVSTTAFGITQYDRQPMFQFPARFPQTLDDVRALLFGIMEYFSPVTGLHLEELAYFSGKLWQILSSSYERRLVEYEKIPWWTFVGAESQSTAYRKFGAQGITRSVVAARAESANTRSIGNTFIQMVLTLVDPSGPTDDRVLDGPTSEVWINHWLGWLSELGVDYRRHTLVKQLLCDRRHISGVVVERNGVTEVVEGDYYICALPIERTAPLITPDVQRIDPSLSALTELAGNVEWMNGLQLYLRRDVPMLHGHVIHIDTEWALTSISQAQFWEPGTLQRYANGEVKGVVSIDISNWEAPGLHGRPAAECSRQEVFDEVWAQLQRSLNSRGVSVLHEDDLCGWFLDPDIKPDPTRPGRLTNVEPLLVNLADTWRLRPDATTGVPNLFLASDYVRTYTDLATMEGANEAARRAVNGVLDVAGHRGPPCQLWPLQEPAVFAPWRDYDAARFRAGLPWDQTLLEVVSAAMPAIGPPFDRTAYLVASVAGLSGDGADGPASALLQSGPSGREDSPGPAVDTPSPGPAVPSRSPVLPSRSFAVPVLASSDPGPADFLGRMEWYRQQTLETIQRELPEKEPSRDLYDLIRAFVNRPSKGLRPALCIATCSAYGGRPERSLASAAGLEMLHNAFLVHDDIEDNSELRRGQPTLHRQVGVPIALNVGDAMNAFAMRLFRRNLAVFDPSATSRFFDEVDHLLMESLEGQALELGWVRQNNCQVSVDDYLRLALKKTGWYSFIHPMRIGALVAQPGDGQLDRFNRFGHLMGTAFQIQDDILNLTSSQSTYGKEIGGDLSEGKRTLVLSHALTSASPDQRAGLESFLARSGRSRLPRQLADIYQLLGDLGSIDWARRSAADLAAAAQEELPRAFAGAEEGPDLNFIRSLASFVVERRV